MVMAMGLCKAPAIFQILMNNIFQDIIYVHFFIYLQEVFIYSRDEEEHFKHLQLVLKILR